MPAESDTLTMHHCGGLEIANFRSDEDVSELLESEPKFCLSGQLDQVVVLPVTVHAALKKLNWPCLKRVVI